MLRETHREEDVGAAAHVAQGLQSMGYNGRIFGAVGDDKAGSEDIGLSRCRKCRHIRYSDY